MGGTQPAASRVRTLGLPLTLLSSSVCRRRGSSPHSLPPGAPGSGLPASQPRASWTPSSPVCSRLSPDPSLRMTQEQTSHLCKRPRIRTLVKHPSCPSLSADRWVSPGQLLWTQEILETGPGGVSAGGTGLCCVQAHPSLERLLI